MNYTIYCIICNITGKKYIGSTNNFKKRIRDHRFDIKRYRQGRFNYVSSFEVMEKNDYRYEILEQGVKPNRKEIYKTENEYIKNNPECVNKNKSYLTDEEKKKKNKEYYKLKKFIKEIEEILKQYEE